MQLKVRAAADGEREKKNQPRARESTLVPAVKALRVQVSHAPPIMKWIKVPHDDDEILISGNMIYRFRPRSALAVNWALWLFGSHERNTHTRTFPDARRESVAHWRIFALRSPHIPHSLLHAFARAAAKKLINPHRAESINPFRVREDFARRTNGVCVC